MLYAVIMAGGSGTRLWPLSRKGQPKQALRLIGDRTMFQHAVDRLAPLFPPERIYVVTSAPMAEILKLQTPELPEANFLLEPQPKDSAPAAGLAAMQLLRDDPDATMVMLTADHYILDTEQFQAAIAAAAQLASEGTIVTLGIKPDFPATGFGYIELGQSLTIINGFRSYRSAGFLEKPDAALAARFVEDGRHVWNSGMFVWRARRLIDEYASQLPQLHDALQRMDELGWGPESAAARTDVWGGVRKISIDYGIMERAQDVAVVLVDFGWTDVGNWASLRKILPGDADGNVLSGQVVAIDSAGCLVRSDARLVALLGVENMVIVDTPDVLLVCPQDRAQDVREMVNRLAAESRNEYL